MWKLPKDIICPSDTTSLERYGQYKSYYRVKYELASEFQPKKILEIGVRAGYSAFAFLSACPDAEYIGIDAENETHGGKGGPWMWWAQEILRPFKTEFRKQDSQKLTGIRGGPWDLIHIDGDHSVDGALHDMELCFPHLSKNGIMLIDDYDYLPEVRKAVNKFIKRHPTIKSEYRKSLRGEIIMYAS